MILYGASGHGKVVHSICRNEVFCFFDDNENLKELKEIPVLLYDASYRSELPIVITIGNNKIRKTVSEQVSHSYTNVVSLEATVDNSVIIGLGTQIIHKALIQCDVRIGKHCIVNSMSSVDHDCSIGDFVHIAPNSTLCGNVSIGEGTLIGAGAVVIPGVNIGRWCIIAAGSVITKNIPDYSLVAGNPGRIIKQYDKS